MTRRWTPAEVAHVLARPVNHIGVVGPSVSATAHICKPAKYRSRRTVIDGIRFDSKLESRLYLSLKLRQAAGELRYFLRQIPLRLEGGVIYRADFLAFPHEGREEWWDAKGFFKPESRNKIKQAEARYGIRVLLYTEAA